MHHAPLLSLLHLPHGWLFHSSRSTGLRSKLLPLYCLLYILTRVIDVICGEVWKILARN